MDSSWPQESSRLSISIGIAFSGHDNSLHTKMYDSLSLRHRYSRYSLNIAVVSVL